MIIRFFDAETVTRSCNGWNTLVSRAEHERDAGVTRTCHAFCEPSFRDI